MLTKLDAIWLGIPGILHPVLECLEKFKLVVECCFSWNLVPGYKERIEMFTENYGDLIIYVKV